LPALPRARLRPPARRRARLRARRLRPALPRPARAPPPRLRATGRSFVGLEAEILMVQLVAELVALRREVAGVLRLRRRLDRDLLDDLNAEPLDPDDLLRVVREDPDGREAEVGEDLVADPVIPHVGCEAELEVRLDRVEPVLLQLVGLQLVEEADAPSLLCHVEKYTAVLGRYAFERLFELLAAVAAKRVKHVPGEALGVDADEDVLRACDVTFDQGDVVLSGELLAERDRGELAVGRWQTNTRRALDEALVLSAVCDQVGDGDEFDPVSLAVRD